MNKLFPGRPDYTGPTEGYFGLLHHDTLYEYSHDVNERVRYIWENKPENEIEVRLYNMIYLDRIGRKLESIKDEYDAKLKLIENEYYAKLRLLDSAYGVKLKLINGEYDAKLKLIENEYYTKRKLIKDEILLYIKKYIPDTAWNGKRLVFKEGEILTLTNSLNGGIL